MATDPALDPGKDPLLHWLHDFQQRFNANGRAAKLATGWDRRLLVDAADTGAQYTMTVEDARLSSVREGGIDGEGDDRLIALRADEATLIEIFSGEYNPTEAVIDGQLEVYSDGRDKVKLEALAFVIWRL